MRKVILDRIADAAKRQGRPFAPVDEAEARLIATADAFSASRFMGAGKYEVRDFTTLDLALAFCELHERERWMLYAVKGMGEGTKRTALVTPRTLPRVRELMGEKQ